jgi:hypothetical protein
MGNDRFLLCASDEFYKPTVWQKAWHFKCKSRWYIQLSHAFKGLHCGFCDFCTWIIRVKPVFRESCFVLLLILESVGYVPPLVVWQRSIVLSCFVDLCCYFVYIDLCLFPSPLCFGIGRKTLNDTLLHQVGIIFHACSDICDLHKGV